MSTEGWDVVEQAAELARRGEEFALATVVWRQAPSSGQIGSRAIITATASSTAGSAAPAPSRWCIREAAAGDRRAGEPRLLLLGTAEQFRRPACPTGCPSSRSRARARVPCRSTSNPSSPPPTWSSWAARRWPTPWPSSRDPGLAGRVIDAPDFSAADLTERSIVVIATQGHGDEDAVKQPCPRLPRSSAWSPRASAARRCWRTSPSAASPSDLLDRVRTPGRPRPRPHQPPGDRRVDPRRARAAAGPRASSTTTPASCAGRRADGGRGDRPGLRDDGDRRRRAPPGRARRDDVPLLLCRLLPVVRGRPGSPTSPKRRPDQVLIKNQFEVPQPVDKVWDFFGNIPQVAACLPGAELTEELGDETLRRQGRHPDGPGEARVRRHGQDHRARRRDQEDGHRRGRRRRRRAGARRRCRSPPSSPRPARGTRVDMDQDLQLSGRSRAVRPRHDLRRHRRADAASSPPTCSSGSSAIERGESPDRVGTSVRRRPRRSASRPRGWR